MKKLIQVCVVIVFAGAWASCGSKSETSSSEDYGTPDESATPMAQVDLIAQGESLVKASDCKTCHHATNKLIGPSHTEVANKYEFTAENVKYLAKRIIEGGSGVWGELPMTPHADISQSDAEKMARYVLSLDGEKEH